MPSEAGERAKRAAPLVLSNPINRNMIKGTDADQFQFYWEDWLYAVDADIPGAIADSLVKIGISTRDDLMWELAAYKLLSTDVTEAVLLRLRFDEIGVSVLRAPFKRELLVPTHLVADCIKLLGDAAKAAKWRDLYRISFAGDAPRGEFEQSLEGSGFPRPVQRTRLEASLWNGAVIDPRATGG